MSKQNPPGRNKEGNHVAVPPELTSSGRGGGRLNRGSGRFGTPKSSTLHPRQRFEGDIPELQGKTYELVGNMSADLYTETTKHQQATWLLNANMVAIFDEWWKPEHAPPWWHPIEPQ